MVTAIFTGHKGDNGFLKYVTGYNCKICKFELRQKIWFVTKRSFGRIQIVNDTISQIIFNGEDVFYRLESSNITFENHSPNAFVYRSEAEGRAESLIKKKKFKVTIY